MHSGYFQHEVLIINLNIFEFKFKILWKCVKLVKACTHELVLSTIDEYDGITMNNFTIKGELLKRSSKGNMYVSSNNFDGVGKEPQITLDTISSNHTETDCGYH